MANLVKCKRTAVQGKIPSTTDIELGELAINTYDGALFLKKNNGSESIVQIGSSGQSLFIQETEPTAPSPWIWYKTNASGDVIDILKG